MTEFVPIGRMFDVHYGNGAITKRYMHGHPGSYPVYSASADDRKVAGYIDSYDHEGEAISFVRIGYAGSAALRTGRFSVTCNVLILKPKTDYIGSLYLPYFVDVITDALKLVAQGRFKEDGTHDYTQVTQRMAREAEVWVPFKAGKPDLEAQRSLHGRVARINGVRRQLKFARKKVEGILFALPEHTGSTLEFEVSKLFDVVRGKSGYTNLYCRANPGEYPVYTAATMDLKPNRISSYDHEVEAIHYTAQGLHAGTVFHRPEHKFSMTGDAGILVRRDNGVHYPYALYELKRIFDAEGFCWASNTASKDKIAKLRVRFPVNAEGQLDVEAQIAIARGHANLYEQRERLVAQLRRLEEARVVPLDLEGREAA